MRLELSLLPGISLAVVERVLPFVTVFSGRAGSRRLQRGPDGPIRSPGNDAPDPWRGAERAGQRSWRWARAVGAARPSEVARHGRQIESIPGVNRGRIRQRQACSCGGRVSPQGPRRRGKDDKATRIKARSRAEKIKTPKTKTPNPMNCFIGGTISMVRCNPRKDLP